jgi:hypothetical protein
MQTTMRELIPDGIENRLSNPKILHNPILVFRWMDPTITKSMKMGGEKPTPN